MRLGDNRDRRLGLTMDAASESFRMGMREGSKAMSGGGLLSQVNLERCGQIEAVFGSGEAADIAAVLHEMAGPFNMRMRSGDIETPFVASAERMSSALAMTIIVDVVKAGCAPLDVLRVLADAMCAWIDTASPSAGSDDAQGSQSALAARLMAESCGFPLKSREASYARLHALSRFAPALGVVETVLRVPAGHPVKQTH